MEFVETSVFTKRIIELLSDQEYREVQKFLCRNTEAGSRIRGGMGLRKLRWSSIQRQKGKRGGLRIIYYAHLQSQLYMIYVYDKDEQGDLTKNQLAFLRTYLKGGVI